MTSIPNLPRIVRGAPHALLADPGFALATLGAARNQGSIVTDHRTSWVRRVERSGREFYVKVYEYETWGARLRNLGRRTAPWARSRAAAEFDALTWLRANGFDSPEPILAGEVRCAGWLAKAVLVTAAYDGEAVDALLPGLPEPERTNLVRAIGRFVAAVHALGFRDRNLDLRNLLARREGDDWTIAKIDSPRHRLVRPGAASDRLARADRDRLLRQLAPFGLGAEALDPRGAGDQDAAGQRRSSIDTDARGSGPSSSSMTSSR